MISAHFTSLNVDYVFLAIYNFVQYITHSSFPVSALIAFLTQAWLIIAIIGYILITAALLILIYASMKLAEVRRNDEYTFGPLPVSPPATNVLNSRWLHIQDLMNSNNANDWRQAIIESDIMLGDMLTNQGYKGNSIGEQLKQVSSTNFRTLNDAWEAHKVRNEIAHQGVAFDFSEVLARRAVDRYENVFREFDVI